MPTLLSGKLGFCCCCSSCHGRLCWQPGCTHNGVFPGGRGSRTRLCSQPVAEARLLCAQMLLLVGPALQAELGAVGFLLLYLAGGVLANLAAYVWNSSIKKRRRWTFQARPPHPSGWGVSTYLPWAHLCLRLMRRHGAGRVGLGVCAAGVQRHRGPVPAVCVALRAAAELAGVCARPRMENSERGEPLVGPVWAALLSRPQGARKQPAPRLLYAINMLARGANLWSGGVPARAAAAGCWAPSFCTSGLPGGWAREGSKPWRPRWWARRRGLHLRRCTWTRTCCRACPRPWCPSAWRAGCAAARPSVNRVTNTRAQPGV